MAAVTPYEQVDYQQLSAFRPYQLPVNDIFKALTAQNQYWDEGAYRVKSVYENALNLSLSKEPNKQIRDKFLKDSEQQLAKLSTMNLANASVQRMGIDIYKPLFQDRGIISDHAATEHIKKINAEAESARTQEHGKYYNQYNHQYALYGVKEFMDSPDRNAGEAYLKQARNYEAFYDYTSEYKKAMDLCPADSEESNQPIPRTGYFYESKIKERTVSKAYNCLLSNLSPKAIRQLQIEGSVVYRGVPIKEFGQEILDSYNDQIDLYDKKRQQISANVASLNSKDNKMTADQKKQAAENYAKELEEITTNISDITTKKDKLLKGDFTDVYENFDGHAANLYAQKKLYKEAVSLAFREIERKYSADPVQMQQFRQEFESHQNKLDRDLRWSIHKDNQEFQWKMKKVDLTFKNPWMSSLYTIDEQGNIILNPNQQFIDNDIFTKKPEEKEGNVVYQEALGALKAADNEMKSAHSLLFNSMVTKATKDPAFRKTFLGAYGYKENELDKFSSDVKAAGLKINGVDFKDTVFMAGIKGDDKNKGYIGNNPKDPDVELFKNSYGLAETRLIAKQTVLQLNEKEVAKSLGVTDVSEYYKTALKNEKPLVVNGISIKASDIVEMINTGKSMRIGGKEVRIGTSYSSTSPASGGISQFGSGPSVSSVDKELYIDGERVSAFDKYYRGFSGLAIKTVKVNEAIDKVRNEVYKSSAWENKQYIRTYDNESPVIQSIQSTLSADGKADKNISINGFVGDGEILINVPGVTEDNSEGIRSKLQGMRMGEVVDLGNGYFSIKNSGYAVLNQPINNPYVRSVGDAIAGITATKQFENAEPGSIVQTLNIPMWVNGNEVYSKLYVTKIGPEDAKYDLYKEGKLGIDFPLISSPNALAFINEYSESLPKWQ